MIAHILFTIVSAEWPVPPSPALPGFPYIIVCMLGLFTLRLGVSPKTVAIGLYIGKTLLGILASLHTGGMLAQILRSMYMIPLAGFILGTKTTNQK